MNLAKLREESVKIGRLIPKIQNYSWGSKTLLSNILGKEKSSEPQAELWLGAHPKAPALIQTDKGLIKLDNFISSNPKITLGRFANYNQLPFLMKILTAETPLSIQSHPNLWQAKEGFEMENILRIPLNAANRNYKDANHKPELICALSEFHAMCGFRPVKDIADLFRYFELIGSFSFLNSFLENPNQDTLKIFFDRLMNSDKQKIEAAVVAMIQKMEHKPARNETEEFAFGWIIKLNDFYPCDVGVFAPLLLNTVKLQPGEALYLEAGELHAYLRGAGVEIMANSDNVLRGGLTPKHVDVPELLNTLTFNCGKEKIINPIPINSIEKIYQTPADEFELSRIELTDSFYELKLEGSEIVFCLKGEVELKASIEQVLNLKRGDTAFISAESKSYSLMGFGTLFRAKTVR